MKLLAEKKALEKLADLKAAYTDRIHAEYETRAKSCLTCETQGACCLDAHFVNVHITRLEAVNIKNVLAELSEDRQQQVYARVEETIAEYSLTENSDTFSQTFACPLFEKGTGCLVHQKGKPLPCIQHACYENKSDLPPDALLTQQEESIETLNARTYGKPAKWLPLPLAIRRPF